jgi:hypothetical protein
MSKRILSMVAAGALALAGAACSGGGDTGSKAPAAQQSAPAAQSTPAAQSAASTGMTGFGVPECDAYLENYLACVESKVPEAVRTTMRTQIEQTKSQWKQAAATPEGRAGLAAACKQASEAASTAMKAYGCSW